MARIYGRRWLPRLAVVAAWAVLALAALSAVRADAQSPLPGTPVPVLSDVQLPEVELPPALKTLLEPADPGTGRGTAPTEAPSPAPTAAPPARNSSGAGRRKRPSRKATGDPSPQPTSRRRSQPRTQPARGGRAARTARGRRSPAAGDRSSRRPKRADIGERGPGGAGGPSPAERVTDVVEAIPKPVLAAVGALALLALLMTARSALHAVRAGKLRGQGEELQADVGALHEALLPTVPDRVGHVALSAAWRPAEGPAAGGDFHDIFALKDDRVAVIVGDVSGHGREALAPTALVHYTVRAYLEAGLPPRTALGLTDEVIGKKLGGSFATVVAAIYDQRDSTLTFATAGHPVPMVHGNGPDHATATLTPAPIGIGRPSGGRQTRVSIGAGSAICFFTDGLIEARGPDGLVGREGLAGALRELAGPADANEVLDHLAEHAGPRGDDVTVCLVNPLAAAGDGRVVEELEIGRVLERPEQLAELLTERGLDTDEAERAIEASRSWSETATPALLRVEQSHSATSWEIVPSGTEPGLASPRLSAHGARR